MASFLDFDIFVKKIEEYLINEANYSREEASTVNIACNNNEYDDTTTFIKDFTVEFDECVLIDDDAFSQMFPNDEDRKKLFITIQNALHQLGSVEETKDDTNQSKQYKYKYDEVINMDVNSFTHQHLEDIKQLYTKQAQSLLTKNDDTDLYRVLALGRQHDLPLMQNLADTYSRMKINGRVQDLKDFKEKYKLLSELRVPSTRNTFEMAPASFHRRGLPETQIDPAPLIKIDDDLLQFYRYGKSCITFISNLLASSNSGQVPLTPFQIDFWIIPKKSGASFFDEDEDDEDTDEEEDSDDDDDDKDSDEENKTEDEEGIPCDITAVLKGESLVHRNRKVKQPDASQRTERMMADEYKEFIGDLKSKTKDKNAPQFRRF
eukprot:238914_1